MFSIEVAEYRNGVKIGSVSRDFQLKVIDCFEAFAPKILVMESDKKVAFRNNSILRLNQTDSACFTIQVTDPNFNQIVRLSGRTVNSPRKDFYFLPAEFRTRKSNDTLTFQFCLESCFETSDNRPIKLELIAEDESCPVPLTDTLTLFIYRSGAPNTPPQVSTSLLSPYVDAIPDKTIDFNVFGRDIDPDSIRLTAQGRGFSLDDYGFRFPAINGKGSLSQKFTWKPPCTLKISDTLAVDFKITDLRCNANTLNSLTTVYFVPRLSINNLPTVRISPSRDTIRVVLDATNPQAVEFDVIALDPDTTQLSLFGVGRGFSMGDVRMDFLNKIGTREVISPFSWTPDCSMLEGKSERLFTVDFVTEDKSCQVSRDTATVFVLIRDVISDAVLKITNVITPNQDGKNDCFLMNQLPPDNCIQQFEDLSIYNRWGNQVFFTRDRTQDWCPVDSTAGAYFYQIRYTKNSYKGYITLIK